MIASFKCASCSAPLEFEGKSTQKCRFCGNTVIVPPEVFSRSVAPANSAEFPEEIKRLLAAGNKIGAIAKYREIYGTGLREAKIAVEAIERPFRPADIQSAVIEIDPEALEKAGKIGLKVGGSIFAGVALISLIILGLTAAITAIAFFAFDSSEEVRKPANNTTVEHLPDIVEMLSVGGEGTGVGRFKDNREVAVDPSGHIYSSDYSGGRIQVFDSGGAFLNQWSAEEAMNLYGMSADRKGNLYIVNNKGIRVFEGVSGKLLHKFDSYAMRDVAISFDGKVFAVGREGITVFDAELKVVNEYPDSIKQASSSFGFQKAAIDGNGTLYLLEQTGGDVIKFSADGRFLNRIPGVASSPNAIAVDPAGRIFVTNTSEIIVIDPNGKPIKNLKANQAFGIAFNDAGEMFIASRPFVKKYKLQF